MVKSKKNKKSKKGRIIALICIIAAVAVFFLYCADYYTADETASSIEAEFEEDMSGYYIGDKTAQNGFIIYPGGKVEAKSYLPLAKKLAGEDNFAVVAKMPLNLAVFYPNAADGIINAHPDISNWYVGGHSLGGSMAASYAEGNADKIDGLFMLAAYSTADIKESGIDVCVMYGTEDTVMSKVSFDTYIENLPRDVALYVIEGGNHAQFGNYGFQDGDSEATITAEEQQSQAVQHILYMAE